MQGEKYYVVDFKNPTVDDGTYYMWIGLHAAYPLKRHLELLLMGRPQLVIEVGKKFVAFDTRHEAEAECRRLAAVATQINPDRVAAAQHFPEGANKILDAGASTL